MFKRDRSLEVHFAWGYGIALTLMWFGVVPAIALIVAIAAGVAFEWVQRYGTRTGGDIKDVIYTLFGGVAAFILGLLTI